MTSTINFITVILYCHSVALASMYT